MLFCSRSHIGHTGVPAGGFTFAHLITLILTHMGECNMPKVIRTKKFAERTAIDRLAIKKQRLLKRQNTAQGLTKVPGFENLDLSKMPDLVSFIKANRWNLHAKAASLNLHVVQKRHHSTTPNNMQRFTGQSDTYLAISRAALKIYATGNPITVVGCASILKPLNIHKTSIYRYFRDAVDSGIMEETKNDGNVTAYKYKAEASEEQFDNLLELIFNPSTFEYVQAMHRVYSTARMYLDSSHRRDETTTEFLLSLVDDEDEVNPVE